MSSFKFNADDVKTIFFDGVSGVYSEELIVGPEQVQDIILEANEDKVVVSGRMYVKDNVVVDGNPVITGVSKSGTNLLFHRPGSSDIVIPL